MSGVTDRSTSILLEVLEHFSLIDVWKCLNPAQVAFTYIDPSVRMHHSRIDHALCSKALKSLCFSSNICQAPVPDHKVVNVHLKAKKNDRGKGYWKMNNSMLNTEEYDLGIRKIYDEVILEYGQDVPKSLMWDYFKIRVKEFSIAFGIQQAQCGKDKCKELESLLDSLDKQLAVHSDTSLHQKRKETKQKLDEYYTNKSKGYQIRSRAKWVEEGEQSTKYFMGLEKSRQNSNCFVSLKASNDHIVDTDKEILEVARSFYSDLYQSKATVTSADLNSKY